MGSGRDVPHNFGLVPALLLALEHPAHRRCQSVERRCRERSPGRSAAGRAAMLGRSGADRCAAVEAVRARAAHVLVRSHYTPPLHWLRADGCAQVFLLSVASGTAPGCRTAKAVGPTWVNREAVSPRLTVAARSSCSKGPESGHVTGTLRRQSIDAR